MSLSRSQAKRIVNQALDQASLGDVRVSVQATQRGNARFAASMPTTSGDVETLEVSVTAMTRDGRTAQVTGNQTSKSGLAALVKHAEEMAAISPIDPEHMPPRGKTSYLSVSALDRRVASMRASQRVPMIEAAIAAGKGRDLEMSGFLSHRDRTIAAGDRAGLFAYHRDTKVSLGCTARTDDGTGSSKAGRVSHRLAGVEGGPIAADAAQWSLRSRNPTAIDPGDYTVVLAPQAVADLLGFLVSQLSHRRASEGRSYFSAPGGGTRIGESLFKPEITLRSNPADPDDPASPMTPAGAPHGKVDWIVGGKLTALTASRYWAHKAGVPARPSPSSLHLAGGTGTLDTLVEGVDRGILVTRFWYNRMLEPRSILATGLTRDGTFLIQNGKIDRPLKNLRYNDSPLTLLTKVAAMGKPVRAGLSEGRTEVVPPMVVEGFHFESTSEAV